MGKVIIDRHDVCFVHDDVAVGGYAILLGQVLAMSDGTFLALNEKSHSLGSFASDEEATRAVHLKTNGI